LRLGKAEKKDKVIAYADLRVRLVSEYFLTRFALPGQLLYSTQILVCLWFLAKNKNADAKTSELPGKQHAHSANKPRCETSAIHPVAKGRSSYN